MKRRRGGAHGVDHVGADGQDPVDGDERLGLRGDLLGDEAPCDVVAERCVERACLRPTKAGPVGALRTERRQDAPVGVDLEEPSPEVGQPADRVE